MTRKGQEHALVKEQVMFRTLKIVHGDGFGSDGWKLSMAEIEITTKYMHRKNEERTRMEEREQLYLMKEQVAVLLVVGGNGEYSRGWECFSRKDSRASRVE